MVSTGISSRAYFKQEAKPLTLEIKDHTGKTLLIQILQPTEFSTKSLGWNANAKAVVQVGSEQPTVQVGLNVTIVKSKELN